MKRKKTGYWLSILMAVILAAGTITVPLFAAEEETDVTTAEDTSVVEISSEEVTDTSGTEEQEEVDQEPEEPVVFTVTLNANGGYFADEKDDVLDKSVDSAEVVQKIITVGEKVEAVPVREEENAEVTFLGWSTEKDGDPVQSFIPEEDCTLYAIWQIEKIEEETEEEAAAGTEEAAEEEIPAPEQTEEEAPVTFTVTLYANGGYFAEEDSAEVIEKIVEAGEEVKATPVREEENAEVTFLGWSTEKDGDPVQSFIPEKDCTLYAIWQIEKIEEKTEDETPAAEQQEKEQQEKEEEKEEQQEKEEEKEEQQEKEEQEEEEEKEEQQEKEEQDEDTETAVPVEGTEAPSDVNSTGSSSRRIILAGGSVSGEQVAETAADAAVAEDPLAGVTTSISVTHAYCGAVAGDGKSDREAIQKALDLAKERGTASTPFTVNVPKGEYHIDKHLSIYSNTNLVLASGAVINRMDDSQIMLMNGDTSGSTGGYGALKNVTISGGTWKGNVSQVKTGYGANGVNLFYFWHGTNINIKNTTLSGCCGDHFIEFCAVKGSTISGVTCKDFYRMNGADYSQIDGSSAEKHEIDGDASSGLSEMVQLDYAQQKVSKSAAPYDNTPCTDITITGCTFNGGSCGVGNHHAAPKTQSTNITISGNTFKNIAGYCINLPGMTGVTVKGNTATNVQSFAVLHQGADARLESNTATYDKSKKNKLHMLFVLNSTAAVVSNKLTGSGKCIICGSGSTVRMTSNTLTPLSGDGSADNTVYLYGCDFTATSNVIDGSRAAALSVKKSKGLKAVSKNTFTNSKERGILATDSTLTISNNTFTNAGVSAIAVSGGTVKIENNKNIVAHAFLMASNSATVTATGNTAAYDKKSANPAHLVYSQKANITLQNNTLKGSGKCIVAAAGGTVTLSGNTLTPVTGDGSTDNTIYLSGCSKFTVTGNKITSPRAAAISVAKKAKGTISKNTISNADNQAILVNASTVTISSNTASKVHSFLVAQAKSTVTATGNTVTYNRKSGKALHLVHCLNSTVTLKKNVLKGSCKCIVGASGSTVTLRDNTFTPMKGDGSKDNTVYLDKCTFVITGNTFTSPRASAISIANASSGSLYGNTIKNAAATAINVSASTINLKGKDTITGSGKFGIYVGKKSTATVKNTTITTTKKAGIYAEGQSRLTVTSSKITGSTEDGILATGKTTLTATGNTIQKCGNNGINVKGGKATIKKNKFSGNGGKDIRVVNGDDGSKVSGTVTGNTITKKGMKLAGTVKASSNTVK